MTSLRPHDVVRVRDWPNTRGQHFTVAAVDPERQQVRTWDRDHKSRTFPLANTTKVRAR